MYCANRDSTYGNFSKAFDELLTSTNLTLYKCFNFFNIFQDF